jgi:protein-S-isoprenylcysteine O-methyltransferase Ste14
MGILFGTIVTALCVLLGGFTLVLFFIFCWLLYLARREEKEREKDAENTTTDDTSSDTTYGKIID